MFTVFSWQVCHLGSSQKRVCKGQPRFRYAKQTKEERDKSFEYWPNTQHWPVHFKQWKNENRSWVWIMKSMANLEEQSRLRNSKHERLQIRGQVLKQFGHNYQLLLDNHEVGSKSNYNKALVPGRYCRSRKDSKFMWQDHTLFVIWRDLDDQKNWTHVPYHNHYRQQET
jgi:hypothetical protein